MRGSREGRTYKIAGVVFCRDADHMMIYPSGGYVVWRCLGAGTVLLLLGWLALQVLLLNPGRVVPQTSSRQSIPLKRRSFPLLTASFTIASGALIHRVSRLRQPYVFDYRNGRLWRGRKAVCRLRAITHLTARSDSETPPVRGQIRCTYARLWLFHTDEDSPPSGRPLPQKRLLLFDFDTGEQARRVEQEIADFLGIRMPGTAPRADVPVRLSPRMLPLWPVSRS